MKLLRKIIVFISNKISGFLRKYPRLAWPYLGVIFPLFIVGGIIVGVVCGVLGGVWLSGTMWKTYASDLMYCVKLSNFEFEEIRKMTGQNEKS
jgi:hypothetical protein